MAVTSTLCNGLPALELRAPDGACAVVTLHGGHVTSWWPAGSQQDQLYLSPTSAFGHGQAIRGGVPVIFPQFSGRGPLVKHGFARTLPWTPINSGVDARGAFARLRLRDGEQTRVHWSHPFELELTVHVDGHDLSMELVCHNSGDAPFSFTCALHTYLYVHDVEQVQIRGLAGLPFFNAVDGSNSAQTEGELRVRGELDRIYPGVSDPLQLMDPDASRSVRIAQDGFQDVVVWNPGTVRAATLADLAPGGWRHMVCLEAARISHPVQLAPGQRWAGTQRLSASS